MRKPLDLDKADPLLREALARAHDDEILRAVVLLGPESGQEGSAKEAAQEPQPGQFSSRQAFRTALIDFQRKKTAGAIGSTMKELEALSLSPRGGSISRAVVIEGKASQIRAALALAGVRHASLDRPLEIVEPNRRSPRKDRPGSGNR